jgi:hypothetical protein
MVGQASRLPKSDRHVERTGKLVILQACARYQEGQLRYMKRKRRRRGPRNPLVPLMRLHRKPGAFRDRRKEARRRACRVKIEEEIAAYTGE